MADIEKHNPQLAGVLPRNCQIFNGTLLKELLKKISEIPVSLDGRRPDPQHVAPPLESTPRGTSRAANRAAPAGRAQPAALR
jgi:hypothetical protein